jgi:hypothetical protein
MRVAISPKLALLVLRRLAIGADATVDAMARLAEALVFVTALVLCFL